ncbi:hypothetical protein V2J09_003022 [Rumex salicifolius]
MEEHRGGQQSIYKTVREIKKSENSFLYNALRSIYEDSIFVGEISQLWPSLPLLANLRCGLWYSSRFHSNCYFKSTDGHCNNWSFNTSRLNLHVALLAGREGGCIIVDSTRKGKRFPDSMARTIPIWTCVLNRAIFNHRKLMKQNSSITKDIDPTDDTSLEWDCSLHLPLWISKTEKSSIEDHLEEWTIKLESSGADISTLSDSLKKPLRPLWISQQSVIWLNEVPDHDSWDFTPVILVSSSSSNGGVYQQRTSSEFSWSYIPGAGDDEETWARGLTPALFWKNGYDLIKMGPGLCNQKVAEIVEKDRVYRGQRGENAPQVSIKSLHPREINGNCSVDEDLASASEFRLLNIQGNSSGYDDSVMYWLGTTSIAVGSTRVATATPQVDCILNCGKELIDVGSSYTYLHLPSLISKFDRFSLLRNLPSAVDFAKKNLTQGKTLLVCCSDGEDISICVCLAILTSLFDDEGSLIDQSSKNEMQITKLDMRKRLVYVCKYATNARPSRGNLKQVFNFLNGGRVLGEGPPTTIFLLPLLKRRRVYIPTSSFDITSHNPSLANTTHSSSALLVVKLISGTGITYGLIYRSPETVKGIVSVPRQRTALESPQLDSII